MDGDDIRLLEQLVLRDECGAHFSRALGREILAPGDHLHTEGVANLCHCTADVAETEDTERPPGHVITDRPLPSAATQRRVLSDEIDRGIPVCRRGDHAELGQALDDAARHRRALPHYADDLEWPQALDDGVGG